MMSRPLAALVLLAALAGCEGDRLPPFETVPPPLTKAQQKATQPTRVAVCYNSLTTSATAVLAIAAQSCDAGTVPKPVGRDFNLNNCPLFEPARATFACTKP
jgi:hypothetical protein